MEISNLSWFGLATGLINLAIAGWYVWQVVRTRRITAKAQYVVTHLPRLMAMMRLNEQGLCEYNRRIKNDTVADQHWIRADMLTTLIGMIDAAYDAVDGKQGDQKPPTAPGEAGRTSSLH